MLYVPTVTVFARLKGEAMRKAWLGFLFVSSGWAVYTLISEIAAARRWRDAGYPIP